MQRSKLTKFKQPKYNKRHSLSKRHRTNIPPIANQYASMNFEAVKSHVQYTFLIFDTKRKDEKNKEHIQIQTNNTKDKRTTIESNKKIIQKDKIKAIYV